MKKVVFVDDDIDDKEFFEESLLKIKPEYQLEYFPEAPKAIEYLKTTNDQIFAIVSDMNMPGMNGMQFKRAIDQDEFLRKKAIPFIFASTSASRKEIDEAYEYRVQGYFTKPSSMDEMLQMVSVIINYWSISRHPNDSMI